MTFVDGDPNQDPGAAARGRQVLRGKELDHSYFAKDSWSPAAGLSLNLGMRFTRQELRVDTGRIVAATGRPRRFDDGWSPRLGADYDWTQAGRSRLSLFFGLFYQDLTTALAESVPQGGIASRNVQFSPIDPACSTPPPVPWTYYPYGTPRTQRTTLNLATGQWSGTEELRGTFHDEFLFSYEQEPAPHWTGRISFHRKYLVRTVEDANLDDGIHYDFVNPGYGAARQAVLPSWSPRAGDVVEVPRPERSYTAWQLVLEKKLSDGWQGLFSYEWARNFGNYPGSINEEYGHPVPNLQRDYDEPDRFLNGFGELPGTRRHTIKMDASYEQKLGRYGAATVGGGVRIRSGVPVSAWGDLFGTTDQQSGQVFLVPRGSCGVTPWNYWANLRFRYAVSLPRGNSVSLVVDLFNVFNFLQVATVDSRVTLGPANGLADPANPEGAVYNGRSMSLDELKGHLIGGNPGDPIAEAIYENYLNGDYSDDYRVSPLLASYRPYVYDTVHNPNGYLVQAGHARWLIWNPNYGKPATYIDPFRLRIGLEFTFGGAAPRQRAGAEETLREQDPGPVGVR